MSTERSWLYTAFLRNPRNLGARGGDTAFRSQSLGRAAMGHPATQWHAASGRGKRAGVVDALPVVLFGTAPGSSG